MPSAVKGSLVVALVSLCIMSHRACGAADWQIIKVNGHDYLTIENISKFYGLPAEVTSSGDKVQTETVKNPLGFVGGSREVVINGARSWLCFPLIDQDGKFVV